jgi:hypothetical protein
MDGLKKETGGLMALLPWVAGGVLFIVTMALYWQTQGHGLLNLDDYQYLYGNERVAKGLSIGNLRWALGHTDQGFWAPLTWASYLFDFTLFGENYGAMHLHNVVLHALNGVLLFLFLFLLQKRWSIVGSNSKKSAGVLVACFISAAFWAWHPLRVEPVAWIASRKDMVFAFWELMALVLWVARIGREGWRELAYYSASIGCFGLACMGKPTAMTFPVLAVLVDYLFRRRLVWSEYVVPGLMAFTVGLVGWLVQSEAGGTSALAHVPLYGRVLNAAVALGRYCLSSVWPSGLAVQCLNRWPEPPAMLWEGLLASIIFGCAMVWAGLRCWHRDGLGTGWNRAEAGDDSAESVGDGWARVVFVALGFFAVSVAPTLGIANFGYHALADRFTYLPGLGFSILIGAALQWVFSFGRGILSTGLVAGFILTGLSWTTSRQVAIWGDERTLYEQTLKVDGEKNHLAVQGLGVYHYEQDHDLDKVLSYFRRAIELNFEFASNVYVLYVIALVERGEMAEARREASRFAEWSDQELIRQRGMLSDAEQDLAPTRCFETQLIYAAISIGDRDYALAKEHLQNVLKGRPGDTFANYLMGLVMIKEGDRKGAIGYWRKSLNGNIKEYVRHRFLMRRIAEMKNEKDAKKEETP